MAICSSGAVRTRLVGALLLIIGAVLTVGVAVAPDASTAPVLAAPASAQVQSTPTWVNNNVASVALGDAHTCAVRNGVLYCWGSGLQYRLGNASTNQQLTPVKVSTTGDFTNNGTVSAVAPGFQHTCAIEAGVVHCWGTEYNGALGLGATLVQQTPAKVSSTADFANNGGVSAVTVGQRHTCAIENGVVFCWGLGQNGQLGNASTSSQNAPVKVHSANGFANNGTVSALTAGYDHTCALEGGVVYCWGIGSDGQLGDGAYTASQQTPVRVSAANGFANNGNVTTVAAGYAHTCAIEAGVAFCWGLNWHPSNPGALSDALRTGGQLGDGTNVKKNQPVKVLATGGMANNGTVSAITTGLAHSCALEGGVAFCWGSRSSNQLGDGNLGVNRQLSPVAVNSNAAFTNAGVTSVAPAFGSVHSCAVRSGVVFCWGSGSDGRLGHGTADGKQTPTKVFSPVIAVPGAPTITGVTAGFERLTVAFTAGTPGGAAISNYEYSTDNGTTWVTRSPASTASPVVITGLTNGTEYTVKLRAVNDGGEGAASGGTTSTPSALWSNASTTTVAGGGSHSCAVSGGVLFCWGENGDGQLGDGTTTDSTTAKRVTPANGFLNVGNVSTVALGDTQSCAVESGAVFCWGAGAQSPVKVIPNADFTNNGTVSAVALGGDQVCALESGVVVCWTTAAPTPVKVSPSADFTNNGTVSAIAVGGDQVCVIEGGMAVCWTSGAATPVKVTPTNGLANNGTVSAIAVGGDHACVIEGTSPNAVAYCWGDNTSGQLGDGTTTNRTSPVPVAPGDVFTNGGDVTALATGFDHTCALAAGVAHCWGTTLGVDPTTSSTTPVKVPDGGGFVNGSLTALSSGGGASGDGTSCLIKNGAVSCWGANDSGQLGIGTLVPKTGPTPTWSGTPPTTPTAPTSPVVSVGFGHLSVAFTAPTSNGGLPITNYEYSLDGGSTWTTRNPASTASPVVVTGLTNGTAYTVHLRAVTDVGAGAALTGITGTPVDEWTNTTASTVEGGGAHTCALAGGVLYCWGENGGGQLGDGTTTDSTTARRVSPVNGGFTNNGDVSAVALGETHSCAIEVGVLYCWGATVTSPAKVSPSADFTNNGTVSAVALGGNQTCVIEAGIVFCSTTPGTTPVKVSPSADFTNNGTVSAIAVGGDQVCAIEGGIAVCWTSGAATPVKVTPTNGLANNGTVSAVSLGGAHACVIEGTSPNAVAYCWGDNTSGQLGDGTTTNRTSPVKVVPGGGFQNNGTVTQFSTGLEHTCALAGGIAYCWGSTLGVSPTSAATAPVKVPDGAGFVNGSLTALSSGGGASGGGTSCLIKNGAVSCWGANDAGQLGTGNTTPQSGPSPMLAGTVPGAPSITGVTAGSGQLSVAFAAPGSSGSSAITNYEYSIDGGSTWVTRNPASTVSPLVITGLTNGTSYTVLLRAVNATGPSVASGSSSGTPSAGGGGSGGGQGSSGGGSAPSGPLDDLISSPATTLAPFLPTPPQGPTVITPPTSGAEPQLVTEEDAPQVQREPGEAGLVVDGEPVDVEVMSLDIPSARVDPEDRTPAQVAAVQRAGAALLEEFNSLTPEGETPLVTLTNTPTGAVANGVLVDPRNGRTPVPVPVEDLVLVSSPQTRVLLAAGTADAKPERVTRGVVTVRPSGVVAALAHGFDPSTPGEVVVFSAPTLLGAFTTDDSGTFTGQMTLPPDIEPGEHTLVLTTGTLTTSLGLLIDAAGNAIIDDPTTPGDAGDVGDGAIPTPDPSGPTLPATGTGNRVPVLALAVLMMLLGVVTLRRRHV